MRRSTLITIIALLVAIAAVAIYQLVLATSGDRRLPGPGSTPTATASHR
ncbi:MAG: hypothetical protein ACRDI0_10815 [Actinomycetota bacterium]